MPRLSSSIHRHERSHAHRRILASRWVDGESSKWTVARCRHLSRLPAPLRFCEDLRIRHAQEALDKSEPRAGAPAGIQQAADALDLTEAVHCRKYSHRHRHGHRWSRGCRVGAVNIGPRHSGVVVCDGPTTPAGVRAPSLVGRPPGNFINPSNPQDRSGSSNRQDMTQPRAINPRVHDELRPARQRQEGFPHSQVDPPTTAMVPSACFNKYLTIH